MYWSTNITKPKIKHLFNVRRCIFCVVFVLMTTQFRCGNSNVYQRRGRICLGQQCYNEIACRYLMIFKLYFNKFTRHYQCLSDFKVRTKDNNEVRKQQCTVPSFWALLSFVLGKSNCNLYSFAWCHCITHIKYKEWHH